MVPKSDKVSFREQLSRSITFKQPKNTIMNIQAMNARTITVLVFPINKCLVSITTSLHGMVRYILFFTVSLPRHCKTTILNYLTTSFMHKNVDE